MAKIRKPVEKLKPFLIFTKMCTFTIQRCLRLVTRNVAGTLLLSTTTPHHQSSVRILQRTAKYSQTLYYTRAAPHNNKIQKI